MLQGGDDGAAEDGADGAANGGPTEAVAVTADDLADEDFGPTNAKAGKKNKKGKKADEDDDLGAEGGE